MMSKQHQTSFSRFAEEDGKGVFEDESLLSHPKIIIRAQVGKQKCSKPRSLPPPIQLPQPPSERCRLMRTHVTDVMNTLFILPLGAQCPFSYATTYGKVFDCVCGGRGPNLFRLLRHLTTERCRRINTIIYDQLDAPFDQFLSTFYQYGIQFKQACKITAAMFNYLEREYISVEFDSTLETEMLDILHDFTMGDYNVKEKVLASLKEASAKSLSVDPMIMMCITQQLHTWDPSYLKHIPEIVQRFIPPTEKAGCNVPSNMRTMLRSLNDMEVEADERTPTVSSAPNHQARPSANPFFPIKVGKRNSPDEDEDEDD
eukprot:m.31708 g.31708  ORF g.31708 m.31708 type:complete len:315 (-) comp6327_c0_seq1:434-1378(-)